MNDMSISNAAMVPVVNRNDEIVGYHDEVNQQSVPIGQEKSQFVVSAGESSFAKLTSTLKGIAGVAVFLNNPLLGLLLMTGCSSKKEIVLGDEIHVWTSGNKTEFVRKVRNDPSDLPALINTLRNLKKMRENNLEAGKILNHFDIIIENYPEEDCSKLVALLEDILEKSVSKEAKSEDVLNVEEQSNIELTLNQYYLNKGDKKKIEELLKIASCVDCVKGNLSNAIVGEAPPAESDLVNLALEHQKIRLQVNKYMSKGDKKEMVKLFEQENARPVVVEVLEEISSGCKGFVFGAEIISLLAQEIKSETSSAHLKLKAVLALKNIASKGEDATVAVPILAEGLQSGNSNVRSSSASALGQTAKSGTDYSAVIPTLVRMLENAFQKYGFKPEGDYEITSATFALEAIAEAGGGDCSIAVPVLTKLHNYPSELIRLYSYSALKTIKERKTKGGK